MAAKMDTDKTPGVYINNCKVERRIGPSFLSSVSGEASRQPSLILDSKAAAYLIPGKPRHLC